MLEATTRARKFTYPALMQYDLCGESYVVLMREEGVGMVVESNTEKHPVGEFRTDWTMEIVGRRYFRYYPHEVVLRNG